MSTTAEVKLPLDALESISRLELHPAEALEILHDIVTRDGQKGFGAICQTLEALTWILLTAHYYGPDVREWHDILRRVAAFMSSKDDQVMSERVRTLANLVLMSARFGEVHGGSELPEHRGDIIAAIKQRGGQASHGSIRQATGIAESNLSRILQIMVALGLLTKKGYGDQALLSVK